MSNVCVYDTNVSDLMRIRTLETNEQLTLQ